MTRHLERVYLQEEKHFAMSEAEPYFELTLEGLKFCIRHTARGHVVEAVVRGRRVFRCTPEEPIIHR
jgi:hypothetical protein